MASSVIQKTEAGVLGLSRSSDVNELRSLLKLTRNTFARLVGRTERTVTDWETGKKVPQNISLQKITELKRLTCELQKLMPKDSVGTWLSAPNTAFGDLKPLEVIERGETDRLWRMIYELESGVPG